MISPLGRAALTLDLLSVGVRKWDVAVLLESPQELETASQERLDQLFSGAASTGGCHVTTADRDLALEKADAEIAELKGIGASIVTFFDGPQHYPGRLLECYRPPLFLEILGDPSVLQKDCIAIVGSRKPTPEGVAIASDFAMQLAEAGLVIVSGLAYGIDKAAHLGSLKAQGETIAVLGSSIDEVYPTSHGAIADNIATSGAVVSEFHLHTQPTVYTFPQRNRVISGLSLGVLVVEAAKQSGSLLTANFALEQNREVFAIPGSIYAPQHVGTNALIKTGAKLVQCVQDILEELPGPTAKNGKGGVLDAQLSAQEQDVITCIEAGYVSVDLMCQHLSHSAPQILSVLTGLELRGLVVRQGPDTFSLVSGH
ncbi:MAG: DNA-processing protein DprA [Candidatus Cryosericum sp.]|nr:DNA-processing protein DprA [bacterium]